MWYKKGKSKLKCSQYNCSTDKSETLSFKRMGAFHVKTLHLPHYKLLLLVVLTTIVIFQMKNTARFVMSLPLRKRSVLSIRILLSILIVNYISSRNEKDATFTHNDTLWGVWEAITI